jgi:hypothetical protein
MTIVKFQRDLNRIPLSPLPYLDESHTGGDVLPMSSRLSRLLPPSPALNAVVGLSHPTRDSIRKPALRRVPDRLDCRPHVH